MVEHLALTGSTCSSNWVTKASGPLSYLSSSPNCSSPAGAMILGWADGDWSSPPLSFFLLPSPPGTSSAWPSLNSSRDRLTRRPCSRSGSHLLSSRCWWLPHSARGRLHVLDMRPHDPHHGR